MRISVPVLAAVAAAGPLRGPSDPLTAGHGRAAWAVTALCTSFLLAACGKPAAPAPGPGAGMPPPEVTFVTVQPKNIATGYEYVGQTAGSRETEVRARISGIVERRTYEEGSFVKAGTVLFQIDPGAYKTQLASAEANAGVAIAKFNQAKRELARLGPLAAENAISQKELDDARSTEETASASLKQTQAVVNEARLNLGYTSVVAPIDGFTGVATKANGSLVTPTDSLLTTLVQTDPVYVNFSVPESDYLKLLKDVQNGKVSLPGRRSANGSVAFTVQIRLSDGSVFPTRGKMNFASEKVNPANGGFDARAQIPNPDGRLRPGQFVRVLLAGAQRTNALAVPQRAVIDAPMGKIVFTISPANKLVPHPVELDGWNQGEWIVTKGLAAGDRVLVDGFIKAHDPGMTVTPVPLAARPAPVAAGSTAPPSGAMPAPAKSDAVAQGAATH